MKLKELKNRCLCSTSEKSFSAAPAVIHATIMCVVVSQKIKMLETLETPVHSAEKKLVLKAISESQGKISVADIATKTSLPVLQATSLLNQVAYETGGHMTVGTAGSVVYEFDRNFQNAYLARSSKSFFLRIWRIVFNASVNLARIFSLAMFFIIRVSFGILLILSVVLIVVLVVVAVMAILAKMFGNDNNDGPDFDLSGLFRGTGGIFRYWMIDWLWDWMYWGRYISWDTGSRQKQIPRTGTQNNKQDSNQNKESFLDKCFSFLFGDGDPNAGLTERTWQTLALALKANNGVVVAEQLAPYVLTEAQKNEDWILPILVRFNGSCEVSESGNIVYKFPSFQQNLDTEKSALAPEENANPEELHSVFQAYIKNKQINQTRLAVVGQLDSYLKEKTWELSHVSGGSRTAIISFAVFIMVGSIWLTTMSVAIPIMLALTPLLLAIAAYGAMFLIIPGIRYLIIQNKNSAIEKRNSVRFQAAQKLENPGAELAKKLDESEQMRKVAVIESSNESVAFTTERDSLEQQFD